MSSSTQEKVLKRPSSPEIVDLTVDSPPPVKKHCAHEEENNDTIIVHRFSEEELDLQEYEARDDTLDSLTQMFEDLEDALHVAVDLELMCPWKMPIFWQSDVEIVPNIVGDSEEYPKFQYKLFYHLFYKCYCIVLKKQHEVIFKDSNNNVTKTVSSPSFFWWKARYTARFLKNVLVPLVVALRTTKPGDLLKENPYIDENYKKFFDHPSTFSFPENDILVRPYSVQTQNNCIRIRMFQKFPTPVEMNREGKVIGWNGYSSSFTISEFVNNLFTIRTLGLAYYGKMENLRKQKMENRRKSVGGSNPTASSSSVRTAGRSRG